MASTQGLHHVLSYATCIHRSDGRSLLQSSNEIHWHYRFFLLHLRQALQQLEGNKPLTLYKAIGFVTSLTELHCGRVSADCHVLLLYGTSQPCKDSQTWWRCTIREVSSLPLPESSALLTLPRRETIAEGKPGQNLRAWSMELA